jgi:hypothetical protein
MSPPTPARRRWTADEQKKLDDSLKAGKTAAEIATALQRTSPSIYSRLQRLYRKRPKSSAAWSSEGLMNSRPPGRARAEGEREGLMNSRTSIDKTPRTDAQPRGSFVRLMMGGVVDPLRAESHLEQS